MFMVDQLEFIVSLLSRCISLHPYHCFCFLPFELCRGSCTCTENPIYEFPDMKLGGLVPVRDLYISRIGLPILQPNTVGRPILGKYKSLTDP
jgi:hypothetical protein